jgi:hypothetical protein
VPAPLGDNARLFRDFTVDVAQLTLANWINPGWQAVHIAVEGGATSLPVLEVSSYIHYEFVPNDGDAQYLFAQPPPNNNEAVKAANASVIEKVGNFIEGTAQKVDQIYQSKAFQFAMAVGASYASKSPMPMGQYFLTNSAHPKARITD